MTYWFQEAANYNAMALICFHDMLIELQLFTMIVVFCFAIIVFTYAKLTAWQLEQETVETLWTLLPLVLIIGLAVPSFVSLYFLEDNSTQGTFRSFNVEGHQWYWEYSGNVDSPVIGTMSDNGVIPEDSYFQPITVESHYMPLSNYLLEVDNSLPLIAGKTYTLMISSNDVIHSFAVPSLGVKLDAIPGKVNMVDIMITNPGIYMGQCSEICGANHTLMPISVTVSEQLDIAKIISDYLNNTSWGLTQVDASGAPLSSPVFPVDPASAQDLLTQSLGAEGLYNLASTSLPVE